MVADPPARYLYMGIISLDANFRLKNNLVSNYSQDPGLGTGWAYLLPRLAYEAYVLSKASDEEVSHTYSPKSVRTPILSQIKSCVNMQAVIQANAKNSVGLRYTGMGLGSCAHSEMILPLGAGNLHKGERWVLQCTKRLCLLANLSI